MFNVFHFLFKLLAEPMIRLDLVAETQMDLGVASLTTTPDYIAKLCREAGGKYVIKLYKRNNPTYLNHVIPLPFEYPENIAGSGQENVLYVLVRVIDRRSVVRIEIYANGLVLMTAVVSNLTVPSSTLAVWADGSLQLVSNQENRKPLIRIFSKDGSMTNEINIWPDVDNFSSINSVFQKRNGNLVVVARNNKVAKLLEMESSGRIVRVSSVGLPTETKGMIADSHGRILLSELDSDVSIYDSEFNPLELSGPRFPGPRYTLLRDAQADTRQNEVLVAGIINRALVDRVLVRLRLNES